MDTIFLITGAAGFIGCFVAKRLLELGGTVVGIDNMNDYYDVDLKLTRLRLLTSYERYTHVQIDIADQDAVRRVFAQYSPHIVLHFAAQAGVRYSLQNPDVYIESNVLGHYHILEACRTAQPEHIIYASSSSVYGANKKVPFEETDRVDRPVSIYAATKKSNELLAHTYAHLFGLPMTGLRFFTVYGPLGRPDMAYFSFANKYFSGEPIKVFNDGDYSNDLYRDFTYIDDIVEGVVRLIDHRPPRGEPHAIYNIGNNNPVELMTFIATLEQALSKALGREVIFDKIFAPMQPGDVPATYAAIEQLQQAVGFKPTTSLADGLQKFADWYVEYYGRV